MRKNSFNRCFFLCVLALIVIAPIRLARADDPAADFTKIREGLSKLEPLLGNWSAIALFHAQDGSTRENVGTYQVQWALDETYLEFRVEMHPKGDPSHHHGFVIYITYNPATHQYDSTYLYTGWALRVTETGEFDAATQEFRTRAFIPLEDGIHDENVHTVTSLKDPNKILYTHYGRYNNQASERMDVQFTLTREK